MAKNQANFRSRLVNRQPMAGTFIKTPSIHATEVLGSVGYDFVVVDEEHAPFDRAAIDVLMLAAKAAGIDAIVRVGGEASILSALDLGATGILVPHVNSVAAARSAVAASRHIGGRRGFSPSPRAGGYGARGFADHIAHADSTVCVCVMIEHPDAVSAIEQIVAVDGLDALFLGLGDLAVAMEDLTSNGAAIHHMAQQVCDAARSAGKPVMATAPSVEAASWLLDLGVTALAVSSDQGLLRSAASMQLDAFRSRMAWGVDTRMTTATDQPDENY